jgi:hypothetical protein
MAYYFLHNITKQFFNETDIEEFVFRSSKDDVIVFTVAGDACINYVHDDKDLNDEIQAEFKKQENGNESD